MSYSMFFGDEKDLYREFDVIARKIEDAIFTVSKRGVPSFLSFDGSFGYHLARWLVNGSVDGIFQFPEDFSFCIHNGDALERHLIEALLNNYLYFQIPVLLDNIIKKL